MNGFGSEFHRAIFGRCRLGKYAYTKNYLLLNSSPLQEPKVGEANGLGVVSKAFLCKAVLGIKKITCTQSSEYFFDFGIWV